MKRCLIIDDSSVIRKVARRILEGFGFTVSEAADGRQALEFVRQGNARGDPARLEHAGHGWL